MLRFSVYAAVFVLAVGARSEEENGKCRTVKDTMLTCLEATVSDLPDEPRDKVTWLLFVRSHMPTIDRATMKLYPALTDLHASNASVSTIEENAFHDLDQLNWVDLSYNEISKLDVDLFKNAKTMYYLNVTGNKDLIIPENKPFLNSPKLNWLDISFCGIERLYSKTFEKLRGLKVLSVAGNELSTLPVDVFQPLQNLYSLDLSGNRFQTVAPDVFKGLKHLSLYLGHNPWECNCKLHPFMEWAKTRRLRDEVRCAKPEDQPWSQYTGLGCETALVEAF